MKSIRWAFSLCLMLTAVFALVLPSFAQSERPLVFADQYVVYADGPFCPWYPGVRSCPKVYGPGVHLFSTGKGKKLEAYDAQKEKANCNSLTGKDGGKNTCSANVFYRKADGGVDPLRAQQWHLEAIRADLGRAHAGDPVSGVVAVVDTGVQCDHEDIRCVGGFNAFTNEEDWQGVDFNGHGTHVAGASCGVVGNGRGGSGVSRCTVMPVKVLGDSGGGSLYTVTKGLNFIAKQHNSEVRVVNMSLGARVSTQVLDQLLQKLQRLGIRVIAAAGNEGVDLSLVPQFPCSHPDVFCVGAVDQKGRRAEFSNYGPPVNTWAPGVGILSTYKNNTYRSLNGTSMATPLVAGAVAMTGKLPGIVFDVGEMAGLPPRQCERKKCRKCVKNCSGLKRRPRRRLCRRECKKAAGCQGKCK